MAYSIPIINDIFINRLDNIEKQQEYLLKKLDIIQSILLQINRQLLTKNDLVEINKPYIDLISNMSNITNLLLNSISITDISKNVLTLNNNPISPTEFDKNTKKKNKKQNKKK